MNVVPRTPTPQTLPALAAALVRAYSVEFGHVPPQESAELLLAQILIETANGHDIQNNSPGNISASERWAGDAWRPPWWAEPNDATSPRNRALHAKMLAGKAPSAFRAFATIEDGLSDYVRTLRRQFPAILAARTPRELAEAIYASGYTRDHTPAETTPSFVGLVERVRGAGVFALLPKALDAAPPPASSLPVAPPPGSYIDAEVNEVLRLLDASARDCANAMAARAAALIRSLKGNP